MVDMLTQLVNAKLNVLIDKSVNILFNSPGEETCRGRQRDWSYRSREPRWRIAAVHRQLDCSRRRADKKMSRGRARTRRVAPRLTSERLATHLARSCCRAAGCRAMSLPIILFIAPFALGQWSAVYFFICAESFRGCPRSAETGGKPL